MRFFKHITIGFNNFLVWLEDHQTGILTTMAVHLFFITVILVLKIRTNMKREYSIMIDLPQISTIQEEEPQPEEQPQNAQQFVQNMRQEYNVRSIPVNTANERAVENIERMVRDIKTEMNITDPEPPQEQPEEIARQEDKYPVNADGERTVYKGSTTVSYELSNRRHASMPAPVYKCRAGGKIVVDIVVNRNGYVLTAEINKGKSNSEDPCLTEAAKRDAERSRFNDSPTAPAKQQGTITYIFQDQ